VKFKRNQANLAGIAEFDGHGCCTTLTEPKVFKGRFVAAIGINGLLAGQHPFSSHRSKVYAE
jgi:hypothetical protein